MKTLFKLLLIAFAFQLNAQAILPESAELTADQETTLDTNTRLVISDYSNNGILKYATVSQLQALFGGGGGSSDNIYTADGQIPFDTTRTIGIPTLGGAKLKLESNNSEIFFDGSGLYITANDVLSLKSDQGNEIYWGGGTNVPLELRAVRGLKIDIGDQGTITPPQVGQVLKAIDTDGNVEWGDVSGPAYSSATRIPFMNSTGDGFDYSLNYTFDGTNFYIDGNIGIGDESPTEKLVVSGGNVLANGYKTPSGTSDDVLLADGTTTSLSGIGGAGGIQNPMTVELDAGGNNIVNIANGLFTNGFVLSGNGYFIYDINDVSRSFITTVAANELFFGGNYWDRIIVNDGNGGAHVFNEGKLRIGDTNLPTQALEVAGNVKLEGNVDVDNNNVENLAAGTQDDHAVNKLQLDNLAASMPSPDFTYVRVTDSTRTITQEDFDIGRIFLGEAVRADATTKVDTIIYTIPPINANGKLNQIYFHSKKGSVIKVVPDTGVTDARTGTTRQYRTKTNENGIVSISIDTDNEIYASSTAWFVDDYTIPAPSGPNLVVNSTLDNSNNVFVEDATWTIGGGVASYDGTATRYIQFELSQNLNQTPHTLTFEVTGTGGSDIRYEFGLFDSSSALIQKEGFTTYSGGDQTYTYTFTPTAGNAINLRLDFSNASPALNIDNVVITED